MNQKYSKKCKYSSKIPMALNLEDKSLQIYGTDTLTFIGENEEKFAPIADKWEWVMDTVNISTSRDVDAIIGEKIKKIVAILWPWAVGKWTVQEALKWQRVINTTTRDKRPQETHGNDYFFIPEKDFKIRQEKGEFAVTTFREWRWWYGITWSEIQKKIDCPDTSGHLVVEENADTLVKLHEALSSSGYPNSIHGIYLLPPSPRFVHLLARYIKRCHSQWQDPRNPVLLESTLWERQIREFTLARHIAESGNMEMDFIENAQVTKTLERIKLCIDSTPTL